MSELLDYRKLPIIMLSMSRWDDLSSASLSLAKKLSLSQKVFYIDNPFTLKDILKVNKSIRCRLVSLVFRINIYRKVNNNPDNLVFVIPGLILPINWINKGKLYNIFRKINELIINRTINRVLKENNIDNYILFNSFNPFYGNYINNSLQPVLRIYQSRDNISAAPYVKKHGKYLEVNQIEKADFSFATSKELVRNLGKITNQKIHYLPNAADTTLFRQAFYTNYETPKEIKNINKRIIGYIGNIESRIDYNLLKLIAELNQDKILLLVGPNESKYFSNHDFSSFKNVIFAGRKKLEEIPAYLKYINCTIIPFKVNKLTQSIYPLKVNEYLAAGKPVVSTNFSDDLFEFKNIIEITNNYDDFNVYINDLI
ncbi:MAG: glycosyltransferase, partial [Cyclobacteriaceae bacterium]